jgi:hypothetical protein
MVDLTLDSGHAHVNRVKALSKTKADLNKSMKKKKIRDDLLRNQISSTNTNGKVIETSNYKKWYKKIKDI